MKNHKSTRSMYILATLLMVISLVLAACAPAATPAPVATEAPAAPAATEAPAEPVATEAPAEPVVTEAPAEPSAPEPAAFDWRKYEGTTIRYMGIKNAYGEYMISQIPAFEEATGIKVIGEILPDANFRQKLLIELQSGAGTVDTFGTLPSYDALRFANAGWYEDLNKYLNDPTLTDPELDFGDYLQSCTNVLTVDNMLVGLPYQADSQLLYYRKDLLEKYSLAVPTTLEEMENVAKTIYEGEGGEIAGFTARGQAGHTAYPVAPYVFAAGGLWEDANGVIQLNNPDVVKGIAFYANLLKNYGPPGVANFDVAAAQDVMLQGKAAMWSDHQGAFAVLTNPEKSTVPDKIGAAQIPGGKSTVGAWGVAVSVSSKNKEAAWYWAQWITSKMNLTAMQRKSMPTCRQSSWDDPEFSKMVPQEFTNAFLTSFATGVINGLNPKVIPVPEIRDVIGTIVLAGLEGQDIQAAAEKAQVEALDIIARAK